MDPPDSKSWKSLCLALNAPAFAPVVEALEQTALLSRCGETGTPVPLEPPPEMQPGYFALAIRLLQLQGWLAANESGEIRMTVRGRHAAAHLEPYRGISDRIGVIAEAVRATLPWDEAEKILAQALDDRADRLTPRIWALALLVERTRNLEPRHLATYGNTLLRTGPHHASLPEGLLTRAFARTGWCEGPSTPRLTPAGLMALQFSYLACFTVSYLPTFAKVSRLLHGDRPLPESAAGIETHLDRTLDIRFSGAVVRQGCGATVEQMLRPLFNREPVSEQPDVIVDTGSGDGTLLALVYEAIRNRTLRGTLLEKYPLTLVGLEYNREARDATQRRLSSLGAPFRTGFGDIGAPQEIVRTLRQLGLDPGDVLHVSKSIFHNRSFVPPKHGSTLAIPNTEGVFTQRSGDLIEPARVVANLVETLRGWREIVSRHGILTVESHLVPIRNASQAPNMNMMTVVEAAHGFSNQLLVEAETHLGATRAAGFHAVRTERLDPQHLGAPTMTIQLLEPRR